MNNLAQQRFGVDSRFCLDHPTLIIAYHQHTAMHNCKLYELYTYKIQTNPKYQLMTNVYGCVSLTMSIGVDVAIVVAADLQHTGV